MAKNNSLMFVAALALLFLSACDSFIPATPVPTPIGQKGLASGGTATQAGRTADASAATRNPQQLGEQLRGDLKSFPEDYDASLRETLGPANPRISNPAELQKAIDLEREAEAAYNELRPTLDAIDPAKSTNMASLFATIDGQLNNAVAGQDVPASATIEANADKILALLDELLPAQ